MSLALSVIKYNMSRYIIYNFILTCYAFVEKVDHWRNFRSTYLSLRSWPFQSFTRPGNGGWRGGVEEGLRGLDAKSQSYHQPIKTKFCIPETGSLMQNLSLIVVPFSLGMMSKYFPLKKGTSDRIGIFTT